MAIKQIIKEYGKPPKTLSKNTSMNDAALIVFDLAKRVIAHGDTFVPTVYFYTSEGYQPLLVTFKDRAEKLKFAFDLPGLLEQHQAKGVMFIAEAWTTEPSRMLKRLNEGKSIDKMRKKSEALWLTMLTNDLETLDIVGAFHRTETGIKFSKPETSSPDPESLNFLRPVYLWWKRKDSA